MKQVDERSAPHNLVPAQTCISAERKESMEKKKELGITDMNGMKDDADATCGLNDMNCLGEEDTVTCSLDDMNCVKDDEDKTCGLNDMNCLGE